MLNLDTARILIRMKADRTLLLTKIQMPIDPNGMYAIDVALILIAL